MTEFLYTLDQVATILGVTTLKQLRDYVHFRDVGKSQTRKRLPKDDEAEPPAGYRMVAIRLRPSKYHQRPEWRVPERELIRYLRSKGLTVYRRSMDTLPERKQL